MRVQLANLVKQFHVRRGVGTRRATDGRLIDVDRLVDVVQADDVLVLPRRAFAGVDVAFEKLPQRVVDQRTLARTAYTGDAHEVA